MKNNKDIKKINQEELLRENIVGILSTMQSESLKRVYRFILYLYIKL